MVSTFMLRHIRLLRDFSLVGIELWEEATRDFASRLADVPRTPTPCTDVSVNLTLVYHADAHRHSRDHLTP
jgi:hypothetical protein